MRRFLTDKAIEGFAFLQVRQQQAKDFCKSKKGQAVMEYAIIFFIAGMGMAASLSLLQSKIEVSLVRQAQNLVIAGNKLF